MGCCESRDKSSSKRTLGVSNAKAAAAVTKMKENNLRIEKFVQSVIKEGKPWTDPDFPPEMKSLFNPKLDEGSMSKYK